jgi:tetratricopeptide (TPR) repeat protein
MSRHVNPGEAVQMRRLILAVTAVVTLATTAAAQRLGPVAKRPKLDAGLDTNSAQAYYDLGMRKFETEPEEAAAAFYWAARINPAWGDALYARRSALILSNPRTLKQVMEQKRTSDSPEIRQLDSLQFRALMLSPMLYRRLDRSLFTAYIRNGAIQNARMNGSGDIGGADLDRAIELYLRDSGDEMRAWLAYSDANFPVALSLYARAVGAARVKSSLRMDRARIFGMQNQVDSAIAEIKLALDERKKNDQKDLVVFYNSNALSEYTAAVLLEGRGDASGAREAYGRALQEDLSYYPAHMRLGLLALTGKDTATATSELSLAAQIAPGEPFVRYSNAYALAAALRYGEAAAELEKTIAIEPYFALPYLLAGKCYERTNKAEEALKAYEGYLAHTTIDDPQRALAQARITYLKNFLAGL